MRRIAMLACASVLALSGCALDHTAGPSLSTEPDAMHGTAMGGQQPVSGASVSIYEVSSASYGGATTAKATVLSDANGNFSFPAGSYTCTASNTPMFLTVTGGIPGGYTVNTSLGLAALIPQCAAGKSSTIIVNEVTTAAAVIAAGQFMTFSGSLAVGGTCSNCASGTYNKGLVNAFSISYPALVSNASGAPLSSGTVSGISITREPAKLYTLADVLAACVNSSGATSSSDSTSACGKLFSSVYTPSGSARPTNTLQAALSIAQQPWYNVTSLYNLIGSTPPFPALSTAPHDWTVGLAYTSSSLGLSIGQNTNAAIDIDDSNNIWFASNKSGAVGIASFSPSTLTFSSAHGAGLTTPQQVAIDDAASPRAWTVDTNGTGIYGYPVYTGSPLALSNSTALTGAVGVDSTTASPVFTRGTSPYSVLYVSSSTVKTAGSVPATVAPPSWIYPFPAQGLSFGVYSGSLSSGCRLDLSQTGSTVQNFVIGSAPCFPGTGDSQYIGATYAMNNALDFNGNATAIQPLTNNTLCYVSDTNTTGACTGFSGLSTPVAGIFDGNDTFWVANSGNGSIIPFAPHFSAVTNNPFLLNYAPSQVGTGYLHDSANGNTLPNPYALAVDGSGNVWVANAGCVSVSSTRCSATSFTLSEIIGVAAPAITPHTVMGQYSYSYNDTQEPTQ